MKRGGDAREEGDGGEGEGEGGGTPGKGGEGGGGREVGRGRLPPKVPPTLSPPPDCQLAERSTAIASRQLSADSVRGRPRAAIRFRRRPPSPAACDAGGRLAGLQAARRHGPPLAAHRPRWWPPSVCSRQPSIWRSRSVSAAASVGTCVPPTPGSVPARRMPRLAAARLALLLSPRLTALPARARRSARRWGARRRHSSALIPMQAAQTSPAMLDSDSSMK